MKTDASLLYIFYNSVPCNNCYLHGLRFISLLMRLASRNFVQLFYGQWKRINLNCIKLHLVLVLLTVGAENGQEAIESGAVFLFKTFHRKECVGHDETKAIKQMFGPFPSSSATAACNATCRIASHFTEEQLTALIQMAEEQSDENRVIFGKNIVFS